MASKSGSKVQSQPPTSPEEKGTPSSAKRTPLYGILLACFTLSGMTGLIYQVLWGRMLALVFGSTTTATGTVLAVFMGGLALGGWFAGKRADLLERPLRVYGLLEGGIGVCVLLVPLLFSLFLSLYRIGWHLAGGEGLLLTTFRFLLACLALLPPTLLMGATLPVLSRLCATRQETLGARIGTLYSANLLGAAIGAFLAGVGSRLVDLRRMARDQGRVRRQ